jgi:beta-glucosidase
MRSLLVICLFGSSLLAASAQAPVDAPFLNAKLPSAQRAHDLVQRMTLEEKAEQSMNTAPAIPRLGVPAYDYWNEGLHGVARSGYATLFPQAIGMAATWDAPLLHAVGEVVSTEARAKYNDAIAHGVHSIYFGLTIWSPNINIFRDPRWGRGQETYGEDPYLTGALGLNFIRGLQGPDPEHPRAIATPKHFAVHSGPESERHRFDVDPSAHDLWDTYLPQFREAIVEGKADSIMCAYNAIDGQPACANDLLLKKVLRGDWGFKGFVTSDCGAIADLYEKTAHHYSPDKEHAAAMGVLTGVDTNCGSTYSALPEAVHAGLLKESDLDRTVERLFEARFKLGLFDPVGSTAYSRIPLSEDRTPAHLALSLRTAEESMVLLKNDGTLPLAMGRYKKIAVVGPNAASLSAIEGNYNAVSKDPEMPIDALRKLFAGAQISYSQGAPYAAGVGLPVSREMLLPSLVAKVHGLKAEYFAVDTKHPEAAFSTQPVVTRIDRQIDFDWNSAAPVAGVQQEAFAVRWSGYIVPLQAGAQEFNVRLAHCYPCHDFESYVMKVDGREVAHFASTGEAYRPGTTPRFTVDFADTKPHALVVEYVHRAPLFGGGMTLEWAPPAHVLQTQAAALAKNADLVIAMVGLSPELEGEEMKIKVTGFDGGDRTDIALPASQMEMLQQVATSGKPLVVVLLNGSALASQWMVDHANAIVEAWYPGEFGGKAIADTLAGRNNPSGRLPVTFYKSVEDLPPFTDYAMKSRTYRYYTGTPEYSFGYGLSYTRFKYSALQLSTHTLIAGTSLMAEADVQNVGKVAGEEVAELYLAAPQSGNGGLSPHVQLEGFQRVSLQPGEKRRLHFVLSARDLSEVDAQGIRSVQAGRYAVSIGGSQPNDSTAPSKPVTTTFTMTGNAPLAD